MSTLAYGAGRLLAPLLRTTRTLPCELKLVQQLNSARSFRFSSPYSNVNNSFKGQASVHQLAHRLLQPTGKAANISVSASLQQHGLLLRESSTLARASGLVSQVAGKSLVIRSCCQQLRSLKLPRSSNNEWEQLSKLSIGQRLKVMIKKYWYIAVPLHFVGSIAWFGGLFLLCKLGVNGAAVISWIQPYILDSVLVPEAVKELFKKDPDNLGNLAVAALLYKLATPARYMTTVFGTFFVLKYLLRTGVIVKSATEISKTQAGYLNSAIQKNREKRKLKKKLASTPPKPK